MMSNFFYLKKKIIIFYKIIFNIIFFFRSFKNFFKVKIYSNTKNFFLPNLLVNNIIIINPSKIKYKGFAQLKFKKKSTPLILDFDWDKNNIKFTEFENKHHTYVACKQLFVDNYKFKKCDEYFFFKKQIKKFGEFKGCKTDSDIELYFNKLLSLFNSIRKYGIKTNIDNNLDFMIDRENNLVKIGGGNHRFAISRILGLKKIPVEIKLINRKSFKKKEDLNIGIEDVNNFIKEVEQKYN